VLVTAGPTREPIDAVRFISNPSTGKMGYALAAAAKERGANVVLISGPTQLAPPPGVTVVPVVSAGEMHDAVMERVSDIDIVILAAAVSDFRPLRSAGRKIKKEDAPDVLQLERTVDILSELGKAGGKRLLVGFAAETDAVEQNALKKLRDKNLDMIVMNDILRPGSGFGTDTNAVTILDRAGKRYELPTLPKREAARSIVNVVADLMKQRKPPSS
jgi:phosphopantothenoylcysteine decarboxylase/phosphopantothenate--cysteine ligase